MQTRILLVVVFLAGIAAAIATSSSQAEEPSTSSEATTSTEAPPAIVPDMRLSVFAPKRSNARQGLHHRKKSLCRSHEAAHFTRSARNIRPDRRHENLAWWRHRRDHARGLSSRCSPVELGRRIAAAYGWTKSNGQWPHVRALFNRESGWNPCRHYPSTTNCSYTGPSACGIPQFVPCSKLLSGCGATLGSCSVATQIRKGYDYVRARYGDPATADYFQLAHNYY